MGCGEPITSEIHVLREAYIGPEAPPWSPDEDEDDDDIDLSNSPSLYCTSCQEEVLLPFGVCWLKLLADFKELFRNTTSSPNRLPPSKSQLSASEAACKITMIHIDQL